MKTLSFTSLLIGPRKFQNSFLKNRLFQNLIPDSVKVKKFNNRILSVFYVGRLFHEIYDVRLLRIRDEFNGADHRNLGFLCFY